MRSRLLHTALILGAVALLASGCNEDKIEKMLGRQAADSIEAQFTMIDDPALNDWVNYMGYTLVSVSTRQHIPYTFKVVDSDMVNAFAAPWGHVYVMRGLMEFAQDEDEVWGVVGHEVGHVVHRDIIKAVKRTFLWSIGATLIARKSRSAGQVLGIGLGLLSFHYSREDERDADDAGVEYAFRAGRDPNGMIAFFTRLQQKYEKDKPSKIEALLRTHPLTSARIARLKKRPELDPNNPEALVRIARGYIRRGRALEGLRLVSQAIDKKPDLPEAHLLQADAALERGYLALARTALAQGASLLGYVPAVDRRLQLVAALSPREWEPWSPQESAAVATLLAQSVDVKRAMNAERKRTRQTEKALAARIKPLSERSRKLIGKLSNLAIADANKITQRVQSALLTGNSAVSKATSVVSALEAVTDSVGRVNRTAGSIARLLDRARELRPTCGPKGMAGWLRRTYEAAKAAPRDASEAASLARVAVPEVTRALASSADAVAYMEKLVTVGENRLLMDALAAAARASDSHARAAREALKQSKVRTARAEVRIAIAKINLAAVGATPEEMEALARIVAYFTRTSRERVVRLMEQHGLGLGEAAACLLAARSLHDDADRVAQTGLARNDFVQLLERDRNCLLGSQILLRFVAQAVNKELPTATHEAPRFTS